jgi:hypothetical protein
MHRNHQDFESDGAYDDYLEEVEDLIFRWVNVNADEASEQLERQARAVAPYILRSTHTPEGGMHSVVPCGSLWYSGYSAVVGIGERTNLPPPLRAPIE